MPRSRLTSTRSHAICIFFTSAESKAIDLDDTPCIIELTLCLRMRGSGAGRTIREGPSTSTSVDRSQVVAAMSTRGLPRAHRHRTPCTHLRLKSSHIPAISAAEPRCPGGDSSEDKTPCRSLVVEAATYTW
ncbi:hypothetical protein M3J09_006773 [Ascochyta lentis]